MPKTEELTEENAAFIAVQKIAIADIVATKNSTSFPEGAIIHECISVYVVVVPAPKEAVPKNDLDCFLHRQDMAKNNIIMRKAANIKPQDFCYAVTEITHSEIENSFRAIHFRNELTQEIVEVPKGHENIIVITEKLT